MLRIPVLSIVCLLIVLNPMTALSEPLQIEKEDSVISISAGEQPFLRYKFAEVPYKPYVSEFFTPKGINILRDAPSDHLHHHALMFAISVNGVNFWEEHLSPGQQKHTTFSGMERGPQGETETASFQEEIDWINPRTEELLIQETRAIKAYSDEDLEANLLTWETKFSLLPEKESATLSGSRYFGLGLRFLESMDSGGTFLNADGATGIEGTNDIQSNWCAYTASADGLRVTLAAFNDPKNPRSPATWFTMENFAYMAATLALDDEPLVMKDKTLRLRYGVVVWDGEVAPAEIEALYRKWLKLLND